MDILSLILETGRESRQVPMFTIILKKYSVFPDKSKFNNNYLTLVFLFSFG